jgi:hypothetical protein
MRKKINITIRAEWIEAIEELDEAVQLAVFKAVANYIKDGTETEIEDYDGDDVYQEIKEDIDERAEICREKAAAARLRRATAVPGMIPENAPDDIDVRAEKYMLVDWVMTNSGLKEFKRFDKQLLKELAVQVCDWWRANPTEAMPSAQRMTAEFNHRFGAVAAHLAGNAVVTRAKWRAYIAPFDKKKCA